MNNANNLYMLKRRSLLKGGAALLAAPALLNSPVRADGKSLYVNMYGGAQGAFIRDNVVPEFEKEFGCKVYMTEGVTLTTITALRTQKDNPNISVAMMDDVGIPVAKAENLLQELPADLIPNLANVFPNFHYGEGYGVGFAISYVSPWYNTALENKPTSWFSLWEERFRGRYMMISSKYNNSLMLLTVAAAMETGKPFREAQYELEKGWIGMEKLKANVQTVYDTNGAVILQVAQGQADIAGPDYSKGIIPYIEKGAAIEMMAPQEGSFAGVNCITLVKGAPEPELGAAFINRILAADVQKGISDVSFAAPSVKGIEFTEEVAKMRYYGEDRMKELLSLDWSFFNPRRSEIIDKYNSILG